MVLGEQCQADMAQAARLAATNMLRVLMLSLLVNFACAGIGYLVGHNDGWDEGRKVGHADKVLGPNCSHNGGSCEYSTP